MKYTIASPYCFVSVGYLKNLSASEQNLILKKIFCLLSFHRVAGQNKAVTQDFFLIEELVISRLHT